MRIDDFSVVVLNQPVKHVQMCLTEDEESSCQSFSVTIQPKTSLDLREESTPEIRATVLADSITSPGSSSCLTLRCLSSTMSS